MASLRALSPIPVRFSGVGGEGLLTLFPIEEIAIMGLWERLPHIYSVKKKIEDTVNAAMVFQPHAVVTIDSKGFSFCLFRQLKCRCNQKIQRPLYVHYVAPSFWAWKGSESRLSKLHDFVDHMLCILPFEEEICKLIGLPATYVGHPLLDDAIGLNMGPRLSSDKSKHQRSSEAFRLEHGLHLDATIITMLPGSRMQEVVRMLPIFLHTVQHLRHTFNELSLVIPVAPRQAVRIYVEKVAQSESSPVLLILGGHLKKHMTHSTKGYKIIIIGNSGIYTSKSAYNALFVRSIKFTPWKRIWKTWAPLRCKFFLWLAIFNRCWTADQLAKRGLPHPALCPLCYQVDETIQHILISCVFAREVWFTILLKFGLQAIAPQLDTAFFSTWWYRASQRGDKQFRKGLNSLIILVT